MSDRASEVSVLFMDGTNKQTGERWGCASIIDLDIERRVNAASLEWRKAVKRNTGEFPRFKDIVEMESRLQHQFEDGDFDSRDWADDEADTFLETLLAGSGLEHESRDRRALAQLLRTAAGRASKESPHA